MYELLRAIGMIAAENSSVKVVFVGDGEEREGLGKEAQRLGIGDRVIFAGVRKRRRADVCGHGYLRSSLHMQRGLRHGDHRGYGYGDSGHRDHGGGIPELITDGKNGILVPPGNEKALAVAIQKYLTARDFSAQVASAGRQTVESEFSDKTLGDRFEGLFKTLEVR